MKTYGVMDMGTNSVRLLIAGSDGKTVVPKEYHLRTTRLGEGMHLEPRLLPAAMERTLLALREYKGILDAARVDGLTLAATSAVREAENRGELVEAIAREMGWQVRILPGEEEGRLSYMGALLGVGGETEGSLVLDIGGGSTELAMAAPEGLRRISIKAGAVRLTQGGWSEAALNRLVRPAADLFRPLAPRRVIGVGGTITTLAAMDLGLESYDSRKVTGRFVPLSRVEEWERRLTSLDMDERKRIPGLQPERADIILAGMAILRTVLVSLRADGVVASDWDLLHALCIEMGQKE